MSQPAPLAGTPTGAATQPAPRAHRGTIMLEQAPVLSHAHLEAEQHVLRLQAPRCASQATPGSFVHLRCAEDLPMRRPLSIMRADSAAGWIELLYKVVGPGTRALARLQPQQTLSVLGPIGHGFVPHPQRARVLAIGGGVGIPPMIFLAELLRTRTDAAWKPLVLMGSEIAFPFRARPSTLMIPGVPEGVIAGMPLLEEWGVPSRLATLSGFAGCFDGYVTELARAWLAAQPPAALAETEIFACGPTPMLAATARLAREFCVPCQVALEEFMVCAVGGCAGCAVAVQTPAGPAMKRVCVDGPVFEANTIFPAEPAG
jgi:dihydroorotate dehydrogenase electron transfer subunit